MNYLNPSGSLLETQPDQKNREALCIPDALDALPRRGVLIVKQPLNYRSEDRHVKAHD